MEHIAAKYSAIMSPEDLEHARRIFDYHQLNHSALPADVMVVLGSNDMRVAEFAAELYHAGLSEKLVVTGGLAHQNDLLATGWDRPEAEVFAEILTSQGVPRDKMMLETHALNTAESLALSRRVIESAGLTPRSILIIVKPFMQRRVMATHAVVWPEMPASVTSWTCKFDDYCNDLLPTYSGFGSTQRAVSRLPSFLRKMKCLPEFQRSRLKGKTVVYCFTLSYKIIFCRGLCHGRIAA